MLSDSNIILGSDFHGALDEVQLWQKQLDVDEINQYSTSRPEMDAKSLMAYWNFNEGVGLHCENQAYHSRQFSSAAIIGFDGSQRSSSSVWIASGAPIDDRVTVLENDYVVIAFNGSDSCDRDKKIEIPALPDKGSLYELSLDSDGRSAKGSVLSTSPVVLPFGTRLIYQPDMDTHGEAYTSIEYKIQTADALFVSDPGFVSVSVEAAQDSPVLAISSSAEIQMFGYAILDIDSQEYGNKIQLEIVETNGNAIKVGDTNLFAERLGLSRIRITGTVQKVSSFLEEFAVENKAQLSSEQFDIELTVTDAGPMASESLRRKISYFHAANKVPQIIAMNPPNVPTLTSVNVHLSVSSDSDKQDCIITLTGETTIVATRVEGSKKVSCLVPAVETAGVGSLRLRNANGLESHALPLLVYDLPIVTEIKPSNIATTGGTKISIYGSGFEKSQNVFCKFGEAIETTGAIISSNEVQCTTPSWNSPEDTVQVSVSMNGIHYSKAGAVNFESAPTPYWSFPKLIQYSTERFTSIGVRGVGFQNRASAACRIGDVVVPLKFTSTTLVHCDVGDGTHLPIGQYAIYVSNNGIDFYSGKYILIDVVEAAKVAVVSPTSGSIGGGTLITITGSGFSSNTGTLLCRFADRVVEATFVSSSLIECKTPVMSGPQTVSLEISSDGSNFAPSGFFFDFLSDVIVTAVEPNTGPTTGLTLVTVVGDNFPKELEIMCQFKADDGKTFLQSALWISTNAVQCLSPAVEHEQSSSISITTNSQDFVYNDKLSFTYHKQLSIAALNPRYLLARGGTDITIEGEGFIDTSTLTCKFGDEQAPGELIGSTTVRCALPAMSHLMTGDDEVKALEVQVSNNGVQFSETDQKIYLYQEPFDLAVNPTMGYVGGATVVEVALTGRKGLVESVDTSKIACRANGELIVGTLDTSEKLQCTLPGFETPVFMPFEVTMNGIDFFNIPSGFSIMSVPVLGDFSPLGIPEAGGSSFALELVEGLPSCDCFCQFDDVEVPAIVDGNSVRCVSPTLSSGSTIVSLTLDHVRYFTHPTPLKVFSPPVVSSIDPSSVLVTGGDDINLGGQFDIDVDMEAIVCRFDHTYVQQASSRSATHVSCPTPAIAEHGAYSVEISMNSGSDFHDTGLVVAYYPEIPVRYVTPIVAPLNYVTWINVLLDEEIQFTSVHCHFQDFETKKAVVISTRYLACEAPMVSEETDLQLKIMYTDSEVHSSTVFTLRFQDSSGFEFYPTSGPILGYTQVLVSSGSSQFPVEKCRFGNVDTSAERTSHNAFVCHSPAVKSKGAVELQVIGANETLLATTDFNYYEPAIVEKVVPSSIQTGAVKQDVMLYGRNFLEGSSKLSCSFDGSRSGRVTVVDDSTVRCSVPDEILSHTQREVSHVVNVQVSNNAVDFTDAPDDSLTVYPLMKIVSIDPSNAQQFATTQIKVSGKSFPTTTVAYCHFGSLPPSDAVLISSTQIQCDMSGAMDLEEKSSQSLAVGISTNGEDILFSKVALEYHQKLTISRLEPSWGYENNLPNIVVYGDFKARHLSYMCEFAGNFVLANWIDEERISCHAPPRSPGAVDVRVTTNKQHFSDRALPFEYLVSISIYSISPTSGQASGGTLVKIRGGFNVGGSKAVVSCKFDSFVVQGSLMGTDTILCESPAHDVGKTDVQVSLVGKFYISTGALFEYTAERRLTSITPKTGSLGGGYSVRLMGSGFYAAKEYSCKFNATVVPGSYISSTEIACVVPESAVVGSVSVQVSSEENVFMDSGLVFKYRGRS